MLNRVCAREGWSAARSDWRVLALATAFVCAALWKEMNGGKSRSLSHVIEFVKDKSGHKGDIIKDKLVSGPSSAL